MSRTLREAAQMALDALLIGYHRGTHDAIAALREALAAPEPEPVAWYYVEDPWGANEWHFMTDSPESQECDPRDWTPLYATPIDGFGGNLDEAFDRTASHCEGRYVSVPAPAVREPQDERIRWRDAVIKEAESALRTAEQEFADMPTWANMGHAAKKVTHALAVIAVLGIGGGGK